MSKTPVSASAKINEPEDNSVGSWLRRNQALLGAIIIFASFLVRDELLEQAKTSASAIETAENMFLIREDIRSAVNKIKPDAIEDFNLQFRNTLGLAHQLGDPKLENDLFEIFKMELTAYSKDQKRQKELLDRYIRGQADINEVLSNSGKATGPPQEIIDRMNKFAQDLQLKAAYNRGVAEQENSILNLVSFLIAVLGLIVAWTSKGPAPP